MDMAVIDVNFYVLRKAFGDFNCKVSRQLLVVVLFVLQTCRMSINRSHHVEEKAIYLDPDGICVGKKRAKITSYLYKRKKCPKRFIEMIDFFAQLL